MASANDKARFELGWRNHWLQAWPILIHSTVLLLCPAYFYVKFGPESLSYALKAAVVILLVVLIPHVIIHVRYTLLCVGTVIEMDRVRLLIRSRTSSICVRWSDVERVVVTQTRAQQNGALQWFPWDSYCYATILCKDGRKFVVLSLLVPRLEMPFGKKKVESSGVLYAWPPRIAYNEGRPNEELQTN